MSDSAAPRPHVPTAWLILIAVSLGHFLNDVIQSLLSAVYPLLHAEFALDYWQIGVLTLAFQGTASLLQPLIGHLTDGRPVPMAMSFGMALSLAGLSALALAPSYAVLLLGAMLIGTGSAIFHPEASRVARLASGGRYGAAQSVFQVGGNAGSAAGPLLAAFIVAPFGRGAIGWFALAAILGMIVLGRVGRWYAAHLRARATARAVPGHSLPRHRVILALAVLAALVFTKNFYTASLSSYYTFFLIERFGLGVQQAQLMLFLYLAAMACGVMLGGLVNDRVGPLRVIWFSILGVLPFTLALPYANLVWTGVLTVLIGLILASAFTAIVVYAQELVPGRVGLISGLFFGLAFGMGGIAAAILGFAADHWGIDAVYRACSVLPLFGLLTVFLPRGRALAA